MPIYLLRTFCRLYTILMAFAVERACDSFITYYDLSESTTIGRFIVFVTLAAFVLTALPFYHGTCRHWELSYGQASDDSTASSLRRWMHTDFYFAIVHALIFLFLGKYLADPGSLIIAFHALLAWNVFALFFLRYRLAKTVPQGSLLSTWGYFIQRCAHPERFETVSDSRVFSIQRLSGWIVINLVMLALLVVGDLLVVPEIFTKGLDLSVTKIESFDWRLPEVRLFVVFIFISVVRTGLDHYFSNYGVLSVHPNPPNPEA